MSEGLDALLQALHDVGDQDIYTDSLSYRGRVTAMGALIGLLRRHLRGERITKQKVSEAIKVAEIDQR